MKLLFQKDDIMLFEAFNARDHRGVFVKLFQSEELGKAFSIQPQICEVYYSVSSKNVIRGMHFQAPPHDHEKIVHVISGSVEDVVVDLRKNSVDYGKHYAFKLSAQTPQFLYIPKGFAHGFKSLVDNTRMIYLVSSGYNKISDCGIHYQSIGYDWKTDSPIVSERDCSFPKLDEFISPF